MLQKLCGETEELLLVVDDVRVGDFDHLYKSEQMKINIYHQLCDQPTTKHGGDCSTPWL